MLGTPSRRNGSHPVSKPRFNFFRFVHPLLGECLLPINSTSATSLIQKLREQAKALSDARIQQLHREVDILQDSMEKLRNASPSISSLVVRLRPRRDVNLCCYKGNSGSGVFPSTTSSINVGHGNTNTRPISLDSVSRLQGASDQIQETAYFLRSATEELTSDGISINALAEQTLCEVELVLENTSTPSQEMVHSVQKREYPVCVTWVLFDSSIIK